MSWWAPISGVTEERTLVLYPRYFSVPVPNDSDSWSFNDLKRYENHLSSLLNFVDAKFCRKNTHALSYTRINPLAH